MSNIHLSQESKNSEVKGGYIIVQLTQDEITARKFELQPTRKCWVTDVPPKSKMPDGCNGGAYVVLSVLNNEMDFSARQDTINAVRNCTPVGANIVLPEDEIHPFVSLWHEYLLSCGTLPGNLQKQIDQRQEELNEYRIVAAEHPGSGVQQWYRYIANADPRSIYPSVSADVHLPVYLKYYQEFKNDEVSEQYTALVAGSAAARELSQHPDMTTAEKFKDVYQRIQDVGVNLDIQDRIPAELAEAWSQDEEDIDAI